MIQFDITNEEFNAFRRYIYQQAGISLGDEKKSLVIARLTKRLRHFSLKSFQQYFDLMIASPADGEKQVVIDLLTTNETYFFREPKHFNFLENEILAKWVGGRTFRVWSAASSSGEEAYSIAMLLDDRLGHRPWEIFGSDISRRILKKARQGHYLQQRIEGIPQEFLRKYCLKGIDEHEGTLLIDKKLRNKVRFAAVNLTEPLGDHGLFDVIFLRNVLIYFDQKTKEKIIKQLVQHLHQGGYLFIGHSESLKGIDNNLKSLLPAIYQKS